MPPPLLEFGTLDQRHHGVTAEVGHSYSQAAVVCLSRHHTPPAEFMVSSDDLPESHYLLDWPPVTPRQLAAWANDDDATRDGVYCLVLAAADQHLGLVALRRASTRTGADYYVGPADHGGSNGELDLESSYRLEVSGIDSASEPRFRARLRQKVDQLRPVRIAGPALAGVAAFRLKRIAFEKIE